MSDMADHSETPTETPTEAERESLVRTLVAEATAAHLPDTAFDDAVIDMACEVAIPRVNDAEEAAEQDAEIEDGESTGSAINNGGFEQQIDYLLRTHYTLEQGAAAIRAIIQAASAK
jgi:hypothetical protein